MMRKKSYKSPVESKTVQSSTGSNAGPVGITSVRMKRKRVKAIKDGVSETEEVSESTKKSKTVGKKVARGNGKLDTGSLVTCVTENDSKKLFEILNKYKDIGAESKTVDLQEAISAAVQSGKYCILQQIFIHSDKLDVTFWGECIHIAIGHGYMDILQLLMNHNRNDTDVGKALSMKDKEGNTALHLCQDTDAAAHCMTRVILETLQRSGNLKCIDVQNKLGETPLMKSLRNRRLGSVLQLVEAGANKTIPDNQSHTPLSVAKKYGMKCFMDLGSDLWEFAKNAVLENNSAVLQSFLTSVIGNGAHSGKLGDLLLALFNNSKKQEQKDPLSGFEKCEICTDKKYCRQHNYLLPRFTAKEREIATVLIKAGADFFKEGELGIWNVPFLMVVEQEEFDLLDVMLRNLRHSPVDDMNYATAVLIAVRNNSSVFFNQVLPLLKENIRNVAEKDKTFLQGILKIAVKLDYEKYVADLLDFVTGPNAELIHIDLFKLLVIAAENGNVPIFKMLQKVQSKFKKIISTGLGTVLLQAACSADSVSLVEHLLHLGVSTMYEDLEKRQPLSFSKSAKVTELLLQNGADVNHYVDTIEEFPRQTALTEAFKSNCPDVFKKLIECGAQVNFQFALDLLCLEQFQYESIDNDFQKLVLRSVSEAHLDCAEANESQINFCLLAAIEEGNEPILRCLLKKDLFSDSSKGEALLEAVNLEDKSVINLLLKFGADINYKSADHDGQTALLRTVMAKGNVGMIPYLVSKGADVNVKDRGGCGRTALMINLNYNTGSRLTALTKALWKAGADMNALMYNNTRTIMDMLLLQQYLSTHRIKSYLAYGARAHDKKSHFAVHKCILQQDFELLSSLIHELGLVPRVMNAKTRFCYCISKFVLTKFRGKLSPLCLALVTGQAKLAQSMLDHRYLTLSDLSSFPSSEISIFGYTNPRDDHFEEHQRLLTNLAVHPPSLMTLSFVNVSHILGTEGDRREKVTRLGLPQRLQDALLFKPGAVGLGKIGSGVKWQLSSRLAYASDTSDDDDDRLGWDE